MLYKFRKKCKHFLEMSSRDEPFSSRFCVLPLQLERYLCDMKLRKSSKCALITLKNVVDAFHVLQNMGKGLAGKR